jgi:hypothetical protein
MNLGSLLDGAVTLTARSEDEVGNLSAARSPTNAIVKDVVATLSNVSYTNVTLLADKLSGDAECGATITATETTGPHQGSVYSATAGSSGTFGPFSVDAISLGSYGYSVTAADLAGNVSSTVNVNGSDLL